MRKDPRHRAKPEALAKAPHRFVRDPKASDSDLRAARDRRLRHSVPRVANLVASSKPTTPALQALAKAQRAICPGGLPRDRDLVEPKSRPPWPRILR